METTPKTNGTSKSVRWLPYSLALLLLGAIVIGIIASARSRQDGKSALQVPEPSWPETREHLLPSVNTRWSDAERQLASGELGAAYEGIVLGIQLLAPFLPNHGSDSILVGANRTTLLNFYVDWQKKFAAALEQGFPAAIRRLGEGREKLATVGLYQQAGFPQLAETVLKHQDEIVAARVVAAPTFLRIDLAGPAGYHELLEKNLRAKFTPSDKQILIFESPLSAAEEAATWRTFIYGVDEKVMRYFDGSDQKQPPMLSIPSSVTVVWTVRPGPGPATTWDQSFTHPFTSGAPATLHVIKNFFGKITNRDDWPQPEPFAQKLHVSLDSWLAKNLPVFAIKEASSAPSAGPTASTNEAKP